jgi:hypothetical protein
MGTRGFAGFKLDGQIISAYAQYDTYPSGVGTDVLEFARIAASTVEGRETLRARVRSLTKVAEDGTPTTAQAEELAKYHQAVSTGTDWYATLRACQGRLDLILESGYIANRTDIFDEEYSWILDLDEARLYGYAGAYEIASYGLEALPSDEEFVTECDAAAEAAWA